MADAKTQIYVIQMGGIRYAWRGAKDLYGGLAKEFGVVAAADINDDMVFGSDNKPPTVRVNLAGNPRKSVKRFCSPDKIKDLVIDQKVTNKKLAGREINSVRCTRG